MFWKETSIEGLETKEGQKSHSSTGRFFKKFSPRVNCTERLLYSSIVSRVLFKGLSWAPCMGNEGGGEWQDSTF